MKGVNLSLTGLFDILSGAFLYFTVSPLPGIISAIHAAILMYKGTATIIPLPLGIPGFIIGSAADLMSAGILLIGQPPILGGFKEFIALLLFIKGIQGFMFLM